MIPFPDILNAAINAHQQAIAHSIQEVMGLMKLDPKKYGVDLQNRRFVLVEGQDDPVEPGEA